MLPVRAVQFAEAILIKRGVGVNACLPVLTGPVLNAGVYNFRVCQYGMVRDLFLMEGDLRIWRLAQQRLTWPLPEMDRSRTA
jgi:hypothetical protein